MSHSAIDLHKKESQVRIVTDAGEIIDRRIPTRRDAFTRLFSDQAPMRILMEASTESEWVASHLEWLGHEVVVAVRITRPCMAGAVGGSKPISATSQP